MSNLSNVAQDCIDFNLLDLIIIGTPNYLPDAIRVLERIKETAPALPIIIVGVCGDLSSINKLAEPNSYTCLEKDMNAKTFLEAVDAALSGVDISVSANPQNCTNGNSNLLRGRDINCLSPQERNIFFKIVDGQTLKEIAAELGISAKTVTTHRAHMLKKLNLNSNAALAKFAISSKLI